MVNNAQTLARPYAKAVFELAQEAGNLMAWGAYLQALSYIVSAPNVLKMLKSPAYGSGERVKTLLFILGQDDLSLVQKTFLNLLAENNRLLILPAIYHQFLCLYQASLNEIEVWVTTAHPLSETLLETLNQALKQRTKATHIKLHPVQDPTLIGGIQIQIGDEVIDHSISGKIKRLAHHLQLKENP